ncbi:MAG: hypothetical protein Q9166_005184 [cf. Caloplaca sp. 2 TL-2023]
MAQINFSLATLCQRHGDTRNNTRQLYSKMQTFIENGDAMHTIAKMAGNAREQLGELVGHFDELVKPSSPEKTCPKHLCPSTRGRRSRHDDDDAIIALYILLTHLSHKLTSNLASLDTIMAQIHYNPIKFPQPCINRTYNTDDHNEEHINHEDERAIILSRLKDLVKDIYPRMK